MSTRKSDECAVVPSSVVTATTPAYVPSRARPCCVVPSHVTDWSPAGSSAAEIGATSRPDCLTSTRTRAARARWKEKVIESLRPSPFGEKARAEVASFEKVRSTVTGTDALTVFAALLAVRTIVYLPSATLSAANANVCLPAVRGALNRVASCLPSASSKVAVTVAGVVNVCATVARSSTPSPLGEIVAGLALGLLRASATGAAPTKPVAGRTSSPAAIVHA